MRKMSLKELKAWEFYKKWRKENTYCPVFGEQIIVSRLGWNHPFNDKKEKQGVSQLGRVKRRLE